MGKTYLGDAVYAEWEFGDLVLTTEDGVVVTGKIYLEPNVIVALQDFLASRLRELPNG